MGASFLKNRVQENDVIVTLAKRRKKLKMHELTNFYFKIWIFHKYSKSAKPQEVQSRCELRFPKKPLFSPFLILLPLEALDLGGAPLRYSQSCPGKRLLNDWRHSWCTYDVFVGVRMTSLPVFRQTFGYSTLVWLKWLKWIRWLGWLRWLRWSGWLKWLRWLSWSGSSKEEQKATPLQARSCVQIFTPGEPERGEEGP